MINKKKLESMIDEYEKEHLLSGAILVSQDGEVLFEKAFGKASMQLDVSNTLDTKFHIASATKMFISMASLMLHQRGLIHIQDRPGKYLPELSKLDDQIKIHHLLSHTSGLHDIYAVTNLRYEMSKLILEKGDFLTYLSNQQRLFPAGEKWNYSSTGFIMMSYILEKVTGISFGELLDNYFFKPLEMSSTGLDHPRKINQGRAYGFTIDANGEYVNTDNDRLCEVGDTAAKELYSTVRDLKKWCDAVMESRFITKETLNMMTTPYAQVDFDPELRYGYGWFLTKRFRLIGGGTPGFRSEVWQYPEEKVNVIMLWNFEKVDSHKLFRSSIEPLIS